MSRNKTGLENRESLNGTKLVLNQFGIIQSLQSHQRSPISQTSILTGTFLPFLTTRPANWRAHKTQNCHLNFNTPTNCANPASTQARPPPKPRRLPNVNFLPTDLEGMINNLSLVRFQLLSKIILKSWTHANALCFTLNQIEIWHWFLRSLKKWNDPSLWRYIYFFWNYNWIYV